MGPLLEIPLVNVGLSTKNRKMLTDKLNVCYDSEKQTTDLACGVSGLAGWTESCLLNKVILVPSLLGNTRTILSMQLILEFFLKAY